MTGKLRIDTDTISSSASHVNRVLDRLKNASADANSLEGMIPVRDLRSVAVDFAGKWEVTRNELIEELEQVKGQLTSIVDAFGEVDEGLKSTLEDAQNQPPAAAPGMHQAM